MRSDPAKLVVLAALFATALAWCEQQAAGSCGDYVTSGAQNAAAGHSAGQAAMPGGSQTGDKLPAPCPCRGAECSRVPVSLPVPAPLRMVVERDNPCLPGAGLQPEGNFGAADLRPEQSRLAGSDCVTDLFRPPRRAA